MYHPIHRLFTCFFLIILFLPAIAFSQKLTLDEANALARKNYPLIRQKDLVRRTADLNISNLAKGYVPQVLINGQATYQSEVTKVDVPIPGVKIDAPSKDQYKFTADVNQLIFDGGTIREEKAMQQLNAAVEDQQIETDLYKLRDRINQLFLSVLYLDEQIKQTELVKQNLQTGLKTVEAQVQNGVAFRSNANILKAEVLRTDQRKIELASSRKTMIETLSLFINQPIDTSTVFEKPSNPATADTTITRPEIKLFGNQSLLLGHQDRLIRARNLPRTSLFVQGGYGRPGLNLLKNDFDFFYIGGVRLNWSLSGLYTRKNDQQLVKINQDMVEVKKDVFLLNTRADIKKQTDEISKLSKLIDADNEIIELRRSVTQAAKSQLENGVISANDYLVEVNAEDQVRQSMIGHEIQLLQAQVVYQTVIGK